MPQTVHILIIDDDPTFVRNARCMFDNTFMFVGATTIQEAEVVFRSRDDWWYIFVDACVPGHEITTEPLVRLIRETYHGHLYAFSTVGPYQDLLMAAGCSDRCDKYDFHDKLEGILKNVKWA